MIIVVENSGSAPLNYPTFDIFENDNHIIIEELSADNAYYWDVGSSVVLNAVVSISEDAPIGHTAIAWIDIGSLNTNYESMISMPLNIGMLMDNFETELVVMGIKLALTQYGLPIDPDEVECFDEFHERYGKYIKAAQSS